MTTDELTAGSTTALQIKLLGDFDVRINGKALPTLRSRKGQWLLALLALHHGQHLTRSWLAGTLWPESTETEALYNLRRCLSDLRRALDSEGDRLKATPKTLCLEVAEAQVDVVAFDAAVKQGDRPSLERAVELYRGPLLEGCLEEWALQERVIREQSYLSALHHLAKESLSCGEAALAVERLRRLLAYDGLHESALQTLLEALAACGNYAELTHIYRDFRVRLSEEMRTEPSAETTQLYNRLRERARRHLSPGSPVPEALQTALQPVVSSASKPHLTPDTQDPTPNAASTRIVTSDERHEPVASLLQRRSRIVEITVVSLLVVGLLLCIQFGVRTNSAVPATAPRAADQKSVAVLPFVCLSADKSDEYLSDGMTEELLNALAKVKGLRVPGRSSSFAFKDKVGEDIFHKVGEQLHVKTVLEGSVQRAGNKLRITAQLINVADGYDIWSETYDRGLKDILAVQSEIAARVARTLKDKLDVEEAQALAKRPTENAEAHRLYLLGRFHFDKNTPAGFTEAARYYREALRLDPNYALAYCGLADDYGWMGSYVMPSKEA